MQTAQHLTVNQQYPVQIKRLGINGEGIGYIRKTICFIPGALPGEKIIATITKVAPKYAEGELVRIEHASPDRVTPPCAVYEACGGCQLQHLSYAKQLGYKTDVIRQALAKFKPAGYQKYRLLPTIGMDNPWHYRNKLQFQIRKPNQHVQAGLYQPGTHQLVSITDCLVQHPATMDLMNAVRKALEALEIPIYNEQKNSGIVKTVMIRVGLKTKELQVVFITNSPKLPKKKQLIEQIQLAFPDVVSIMQNVQPKKSSEIFGEQTLHLWGKEAIEERLEEVVFDLSARAFFQLNPEQTAVLYQEARKALAATPQDIVIDAYCGVGTIGLSLAPHVKAVYGMDVIPAAIADAERNVARMGLQNATYTVGKAEEIVPKWQKEGLKPTAVVVDPPRTGLDQALIHSILTLAPKKLVYVSCNPSTLARDLVVLARHYTIDYIQSVDMFPQTARVEAVVRLRRRT